MQHKRVSAGEMLQDYVSAAENDCVGAWQKGRHRVCRLPGNRAHGAGSAGLRQEAAHGRRGRPGHRGQWHGVAGPGLPACFGRARRRCAAAGDGRAPIPIRTAPMRCAHASVGCWGHEGGGYSGAYSLRAWINVSSATHIFAIRFHHGDQQADPDSRRIAPWRAACSSAPAGYADVRRCRGIPSVAGLHHWPFRGDNQRGSFHFGCCDGFATCSRVCCGLSIGLHGRRMGFLLHIQDSLIHSAPAQAWVGALPAQKRLVERKSPWHAYPGA